MKDIIQLRSTVFSAIRSFFDEQGFLEVDTPLMVAAPDTEPTIEPFETIWKESGQEHTAYLTPSPEFLIKRLLTEKLGNVYQMSHVFRNLEPSQAKHNPEFMMLEWYRANADYMDIMVDTERLIKKVFAACGKSLSLKYQKYEVDLNGSWERLSVSEAFEKYAHISQETLVNESALIAEATKRGYQAKDTGYDDAFYQIFLNEVESKLGFEKPTFLYDYPASQAALARKKESDPRFAERFELYIAGIELANAFSELTNWQEQEVRLQQQVQLRKNNNQPSWDYDHDFIAALQKGLPVTGGIALGVDRLIMVLADSPDILSVLPFPAATLFHDVLS
ncbi:MAG: lysyl-tRNA synthetase, class [Patescibacteria group bacterium]|nr:lysyl-tRNA synthetase, class [Patescibacteria group bacterium]